MDFSGRPGIGEFDPAIHVFSVQSLTSVLAAAYAGLVSHGDHLREHPLVERVQQKIQAFVCHIHAYAESQGMTVNEFAAAVDFLTKCSRAWSNQLDGYSLVDQTMDFESFDEAHVSRQSPERQLKRTLREIDIPRELQKHSLQYPQKSSEVTQKASQLTKLIIELRKTIEISALHSDRRMNQELAKEGIRKLNRMNEEVQAVIDSTRGITEDNKALLRDNQWADAMIIELLARIGRDDERRPREPGSGYARPNSLVRDERLTPDMERYCMGMGPG